MVLLQSAVIAAANAACDRVYGSLRHHAVSIAPTDGGL
jgi:hypothetical protein